MPAILRRAGYRVGTIYATTRSNSLPSTTGSSLRKWTTSCVNEKCRELLLSGVTIERPETVTADAGVAIGMDTVVGPFAQLLGNTVIGEDCAIGACSIIQNSTIAANVEIAPFTVIADSRN